MNVGSIIASLRLNASNFVAGVRSAQAALQGAFGPTMQGNVSGINSHLDTMSNHLKSVERIIGGIFISQMFYQLSNDIQRAASSLVTFMNNLERARIAFRYFLGDSEKAQAFVMNMEDFAARTAFSTEQAFTLSRRLMAAQFDPSQIKSIMAILQDASSATGGTAEQMDRIVLALTQLRTNGKIAGQELRQLGEAGIPIYKILAEELGIAEDKLLRIGELHIPGDAGVAAVLQGLEKRYKGAAEAIANTMGGMWETIQDDSKMIGSALFNAPYKAFERFTRGIRDRLEELRTIGFETGAGGIFEAIVGPDMQPYVRLILASFRELIVGIKEIAKAIEPAARLMGGWFVQALAIVLPALASTTQALAGIIDMLMSISPEIQFFVATLMTVLVANSIAKALFIFWRVVGLGAICSAVAAAVTKLAGALKVLWVAMVSNPWTAFFIMLAGILTYFVMQIRSVQNALASLGGTISSFGLFDSNKILVPKINTATKHIDEFNKSVTGGIGSLKDVGKVLDNNAKKAKKVKEEMLDVMSFDELYKLDPDKSAGTDDVSSAIDPVGDRFGIGGGFDPGPIEAESPDIGQYLEGSKLGFWQRMWRDIKGGWKILVETVKEWLDEAAFNIVTWIIETAGAINDWGEGVKDSAIKWASNLLDTISEGLGKCWDAITGWFKWVGDGFAGFFKWIGETYGTAFVKMASAIGSWAVDAAEAIGKWVVDSIKAFADWAPEAISKIDDWAGETYFAINDWVNGVVGKIDEFILNTIDSLGKWASDTWKSFTGWVSDTNESLGNWKTDMIVTMSLFINESIKSIGTWATNTWKAFTTWVTDTTKSLAGWGSSVWTTFTTWSSNTYTTIATWSANVWNKLKEWVTNTTSTVVGWASSVGKSVSDGFVSAFNTIINFFSGLYPNHIKPALNTAIDGLNGFIDALNKLDIKIPKLKTFLGEIGGFTLDTNIPKIPHLATGGIVLKDQLIRAGEGNKREAVVPLQNPSYMKPFSDAVASQLIQAGYMGQQQQQQQPILYVGTLIADDRSLKELNRKMQVISLKEGFRGVPV